MKTNWEMIDFTWHRKLNSQFLLWNLFWRVKYSKYLAKILFERILCILGTYFTDPLGLQIGLEQILLSTKLLKTHQISWKLTVKNIPTLREKNMAHIEVTSKSSYHSKPDSMNSLTAGWLLISPGINFHFNTFEFNSSSRIQWVPKITS